MFSTSLEEEEEEKNLKVTTVTYTEIILKRVGENPELIYLLKQYREEVITKEDFKKTYFPKSREIMAREEEKYTKEQYDIDYPKPKKPKMYIIKIEP